MTMKFKTPYTDKTQSSIDFQMPSLTHQSFKKECDINHILKRLKNNGILEHTMNAEPVFADVSQFGSFMDMTQKMAALKQTFMELPASDRRLFDDDPYLFAEMQIHAHDEKIATDKKAASDAKKASTLNLPLTEAKKTLPAAPTEPQEPKK